MNEGTLIATPASNHVPPPLKGTDKKIIDGFYTMYGVINGTPSEKNEALKKVIQARTFFALGGNETIEMELRANERIYLLKHVQWPTCQREDLSLEARPVANVTSGTNGQNGRDDSQVIFISICSV